MRQVGGVRFIEDCYNASPDSVRAAFATLREVQADRRIAVLGDMLELGSVADEAHRQSGLRAAEAGTDVLLTYGEKSAQTAAAARENGMTQVRHYDDKNALAADLYAMLRDGDAVLVKGSRGMKLEEILHKVYEEMDA